MTTLNGYKSLADERLDTLEEIDPTVKATTKLVDQAGVNTIDGTEAHLYVIDTRTNARDVLVDIPPGEAISVMQIGRNPINFTTAAGLFENSNDGITHNRDRTHFSIFNEAGDFYLSHIHDRGLASLPVDYGATSPPPPPPSVNLLTTENPLPTLTGNMQAGLSLAVTIDGNTYTSGDGNLVDNLDGTWSLAMPNALTPGTYNVSAVITDQVTGLTAGDSTSNEITVNAPTGTSMVRGLLPVQELQFDYISSTGPQVNGWNTVGTFRYQDGNGNIIASIDVQLNNVTNVGGDGIGTFRGASGNGVEGTQPDGIFTRGFRIYSLLSPDTLGFTANVIQNQFDLRIVHTSNLANAGIAHGGFIGEAGMNYKIEDWDNFTQLSNLSRPWDQIASAIPPTETTPGVWDTVSAANIVVEWNLPDLTNDFTLTAGYANKDSHTMKATLSYRQVVEVEVQPDLTTIVSASTADGAIAPAQFGTIELV